MRVKVDFDRSIACAVTGDRMPETTQSVSSSRSTMIRSLLPLLVAVSVVLVWIPAVDAFAPRPRRLFAGSSVTAGSRRSGLYMSDEPIQERIQSLVDDHPVLLFMKGSKLFPQCGFSNTAVQILQSYDIQFHTVDVLADEGVRSGVKDFSQWPTIPQLYVAGEFIGGSDIMIEMYQSGELGEMIEKAKADMM
jgi:monothiol glutaredoxin